MRSELEEMVECEVGNARRSALKPQERFTQAVKNLEERICQLEFKMDCVLDSQVTLDGRLENLALRTLATKEVKLAPVHDKPSVDTETAVIRHWMEHIVDTARLIWPGLFTERACLALRETSLSAAAPRSAVTIIIQLMLDMTTHAFSTASANQPRPAIPARVALHTYATLYPIARSALIKLAKMRGHLYKEITDTAWNEAYIMLVSCIDYALDMTCIQSVSQCFIVGGIL